MALSEDQRALLRLLISGETYEQVGSVLGADAEEVRSRAHQAIAELESLGEDPGLAQAARERLEALEEGGEVASGPASAATPASPATQARPRVALTAIAVALVAVLGVVGFVVAGGSEEDPAPPAADQEDVVEVRLEAVGGSKARGTARIVRVEDLPAVDLDVTGLEPNPPSQSYVLWLLGEGGEGVPIAFRDVGPDGKFTGRTQIPSAAAGLLPSIDSIDVSLAGDRQAAQAVQAAANAGTLPNHFGTSVVRGALP